MADSNAIQAQGTLLKMGDGGSPENFTTIGEVRDITGPSFTRKANDVTPIDATNNQVLAGGVLHGGTIGFPIGYVPGSSTHGITTGLMHKLVNNIKTNFKLIFTNDNGSGSGTYLFEAYVTKFEPAAKVDSDLIGTIELALTGTPTLV